MHKIFLIIPSLHRGGAERVVSIIANNLDHTLFDITLVLLEKRGSYLKDLRDNIKIVDLKQSRVSRSIGSLIKLINTHKPDIVFSTLGHLNLLLMMFKIFMPRDVRFVAREASIPSILNKNERYPTIFNALYKRLYPKFDRVVCQSRYMMQDLHDNFSIQKNLMRVINNPIDFDNIELKLSGQKSSLARDMKNIVAVGSLESVKGYDLLIEAIALSRRDDIRLFIIGEGSKQEELLALIDNLKLQSRVKLLGFKDNPYPYMRDADLMVLSSKFEGFPNTVLESMACGTAVVAFKSPGGIEEIVIEAENGWFVEPYSVSKLRDAIDLHVDHQIDADQIRASVFQRYNLEFIIKEYETMFEEVLSEIA